MGLNRQIYFCLLILLVVLLLVDTTSAGKNDKKKGTKRERDRDRSRSERSRHKTKQCYEIQTDFCNDVLTYNETRLPNAFGHKKLRHAERFLEEMAMVVDTGCSPYLRAFLCSIYLPECPHRKKNDPLPPCRQLCERARADCLSQYHSFQKEWPLDSCDHLPEPRRSGTSKKDRCINYEPPKPEYCMFHKEAGPCKTYYPFWYYDYTAKVCKPFTYGGCLGNKNRFSSKEACVRTCGYGKGATTTPTSEPDTTTLVPSTSKLISVTKEVLPPELVEPPRDTIVEAGGTVTLICAASRTIEYTWSRVDGPMPEDKGRTINDVLPPNKIVEEGTMSGRAKLVLQDLDPEDSGMYMCTAENDGGVVEGVADLTVQVSPPVITQFPIAVSVVEGGTFVMICAAEGAPSPQVEWSRFDNTPVQQTMNDSVATAEVRTASMSDEGEYLCRASNKYGDVVTKSITIQVLVPVYLAEKPRNVLVVAGSKAVNLSCTAMGDPLPSITWVKLDGAKEIDERRYEFDIREEIGQIGRVTSTLRIYDVEASDAGTYECVAKSSLGNQTATATITVQVPPSFQQPPRDKFAMIGEAITLQCYAIGTPPLHIFWWKEGAGNLSLPDATFPRYSLDNEGMDLNINNVILEDEGRYHCGIVNAADSIVGSMALTVISNDDMPNIVNKGPENVTAHVGERVVFSCNVTGRPLPDVSWGLDDIDIDLFGESRFVREGTSLIVEDVNARDAGDYRCVAASVLGLAIGPTLQLTVTGAGNLTQDFNRTEPWLELVAVPENSTVIEGDTVILTCEASGDPEPRLYWFHDGVVLGEEFDNYIQFIQEDGELTLLDVAEFYEGLYQCVFDNDFIEVSATALLLVDPVPTFSPTTLPQTTTPRITESNNIVEEEADVPLTVMPPIEGTIMPITQEPDKQLVTEHAEPERDTMTCPPCEEEPVTCIGRAILPRRYDITDIGRDGYFRGWVDVLGQGAANDFCRIIEPEEGRMQLACALAGTTGDSEYNYVSMLGFDQGMPNTWYMKDEDNDGRDDYCRCTEIEDNKYVWCMKAGEGGFAGHIEGGYMDQFTFKAPGDRKEMRKCRKRRVDPFFGIPVIPPS